MTDQWARTGLDLHLDIDRTHGSRIGTAACAAERWLLRHDVRLPFGIRGYTVVRKP